MTRISLRTLLLSSAVFVSACSGPFDIDMRPGLNTSGAAASAAQPGQPDERGVINYPTYQVAMARRGDTVAEVARRVGVDAGELARYNGVGVETALRAGELIALPRKVETAVAPAPAAPNAPELQQVEPIRHQVARGETAYSVSRLYDVDVQTLAQWNALDGNLTVREGQYLIIPVAGAPVPSAPPVVSSPGVGSVTPPPPSSATALPETSPEPVQTSGATAAAPVETPALETTPAVAEAPAREARLVRPVAGNVIREYSKGRNEGIDISAAAGTAVKAADSGVVAAVTQNTNGAQIVVVKHAGDLLTVYVNVDDLKVQKGDSVSRGQTIAEVASGEPTALHFEVRKGLESMDPNDFL